MLKKKNPSCFKRNRALQPGTLCVIPVAPKHMCLVFLETLSVSLKTLLIRFALLFELSDNFAFNQPRWISTFLTKNDHVSTKFNITFQKNLRFAESCIVEHSLAIRDQLSTLTPYGNYYDVRFLVCMLQTRDHEVPRA